MSAPRRARGFCGRAVLAWHATARLRASREAGAGQQGEGARRWRVPSRRVRSVPWQVERAMPLGLEGVREEWRAGDVRPASVQRPQLLPGVRGGGGEVVALLALALACSAHDSLNHTRNCSRWRQPQTVWVEQVAQKGARRKENKAIDDVATMLATWNNATSGERIHVKYCVTGISCSVSAHLGMSK